MMRSILLILATVVALTGCSNRAWYDGFQQSLQRECLKSRDDCDEPRSYDEYKRERDRQLDDD